MTDNDPAPRRGFEPVGSGPEAADTEPAATTPVPPPVPVLPEAETDVSAPGRRFSAEPTPAELAGAEPRRSAASVSSPPEPVTDDAAPAGRARNRRRIAIGVGALAAITILALIVWAVAQRPGVSAGPPGESSAVSSETPSATSPAPLLTPDMLVAPADLRKLRKDTRWTLAEATPSPSAGAGQPACVQLSGAGLAPAEAELSTSLRGSSSGAGLIQVIRAMPDQAAATAAHNSLVGQVAACPGARILSGYAISGLADAAVAVATAPLSEATSHTVMVTRSGRFVTLTDARVLNTGPISASSLAAAIAPSLTRQCPPSGGTCPSTPKVTAAPPPPTEVPGWLAWVDLPRVSAGAGTWTATDPAAPDLVGSQCEVLDLNKLPGATDAKHRTYLLTEDVKAPHGFGIDEAVFTFGKAAAASKALADLAKGFDGCAERTRTATVKDTSVEAPGAAGKELRATSYQVVQRISDSKTVTFRVALAAVGNRLMYLLANPSAGFDFTEPAWRAIVGRATQRVTQTP